MKPLYEEQDLCLECGQPCDPNEHDEQGNPIHEQCRIDREAMKADDRRVE